MFFYAQIDENGIVFSISQLAGEVKRPDMIPLTEQEFSTVCPGWKWDGKKWNEPEETEAV